MTLGKLLHQGNITLVKLALLAALFLSSAGNAALPAETSIQGLSQLHNEIIDLPFDPEIIQQMLQNIDVAQAYISAGDMDGAREATLDFCRKIEWYRYQVGHQKVSDMFNQAMVIAVDLHNSSLK